MPHLDGRTTQWVTADTHQFSDLRPPTWVHVRRLLELAAGTLVHLQLPEPASGARGQLTALDDVYDLLCLPASLADGSTYATLLDYTRVAPAWMHSQPAHTRRLLQVLRRHPVNEADPRSGDVVTFGGLTTDELIRIGEPFLHLKPTVADAAANMLTSFPEHRSLPLTDLAHLVHALTHA